GNPDGVIGTYPAARATDKLRNTRESRQLALTSLTARACWAAVGSAAHIAELAIRIPGAICMFGSGIVMSPAGEAVTSLIAGALTGATRMCMTADRPTGDAVPACALMTISGPPATRATLSSTAAATAETAGMAMSCSRRTCQSFLLASSQQQPTATTASSTVHRPSPNPSGSTAFGVGPTTSPTVRVT